MSTEKINFEKVLFPLIYLTNLSMVHPVGPVHVKQLMDE